MFDVGSIVAHIKADLSNFKAGLDEAKSEADSFGARIGGVASGVKEFGEKAAVFTGLVGVGFGLLGKSTIDYASNLEQARIAYDAFTGSAEKGGKALEMVTDFARHTPFQLPEVVAAGQQLLGFGFSLDDLKQKLKEAGSLAAGTHQPMNVAIDLFARAREGIVNIRELGQFGIGKDALEQFGVQFDKAGGAINKSQLLPAIEKLINSRFGESLQRESETFGGIMSNIMDDMGRLGSSIVGVDPNNGDVIKGSIFAKLKNAAADFYSWFDANIGNLTRELNGYISQAESIFTGIYNALQPLIQWIKANPTLVKEFLQGIAIGIGALLVIGTITLLINTLFNPLSLLVMAITALYMAWKSNFFGFRDITNSVVKEIINFFNNYLMPVIEIFEKWWADHWSSIAAEVKGIWEIMLGIIQVLWAIIYGLIKVGIDLLTGNWKQAWEDIKDTLKNAWNGLLEILRGAVDYLGSWGRDIFGKLTQPFQDAWHTISDLMNKIKDALDFTKRHSPSVVDIVENGVDRVNEALSGLNMNIGIPGQKDTVGIAAGIQSPMGNIYIDMSGAIIADQRSATAMGEKIGDSIINKLKLNIRF